VRSVCRVAAAGARVHGVRGRRAPETAAGRRGGCVRVCGLCCANKVAGARCDESQHQGSEAGHTGRERGPYLLVVACLALFFVLDRLDVVHAAGTCFRRGARRGRDLLMAAAVFVYDLEAHVGGQRRGEVVARRGRLRYGRRGCARKAGWGVDALIGRRAQLHDRTQTGRRTTAGTVAAGSRRQCRGRWSRHGAGRAGQGGGRLASGGGKTAARAEGRPGTCTSGRAAGGGRRRRWQRAEGSEGASKREIWGGAMFYNAAMLRARQTVPRRSVRLLPLPFAKTEVQVAAVGLPRS
jgi:hypothetical protein